MFAVRTRKPAQYFPGESKRIPRLNNKRKVCTRILRGVKVAVRVPVGAAPPPCMHAGGSGRLFFWPAGPGRAHTSRHAECRTSLPVSPWPPSAVRGAHTLAKLLAGEFSTARAFTSAPECRSPLPSHQQDAPPIEQRLKLHPAKQRAGLVSVVAR